MFTEALSIINKFIPDKSKAKKLEAEIQKAHQEVLSTAVKADTQVRLAELKSKGIASVWRPIAALTIFSCIFLYWFIYPLMRIMVAMFDWDIYLPQLQDLPTDFYLLAGSFVTVYAYSRGLEKRGR